MLSPARPFQRDPAPLLAQTLETWGASSDLWLFGYASLIWRPDFEVAEQHLVSVHGWHRSLSMWSRVNRGTPERPGLVFALRRGGSCRGMLMRVPRAQGEVVLRQLWDREMPSGVYDPTWLRCRCDAVGPGQDIRALAFTLPSDSPSHTGRLSDEQYRQIFNDRVGGRYGHTLDYAQKTHASLLALGIRDRALERLLRLAPSTASNQP